MRFGSTRHNISALTVFFILATVVGVFYFDFSTVNVLTSIFFFYLLNIGGIWLTMHRYYSHRSFEFRNKFLKYFFTALAVLAGRGSILGWVYIHRIHHQHADSDSDPHPPKLLGLKFLGFGHYKKLEQEKMQTFLVKDVFSKEHLFIHKYYLILIASFVALLGAFDPELLYFLYVLPCFFVHVSQVIFNYYGHVLGYRNFETADNSRNNLWLFPFILGEAWHNNHHHNGGSYTTKIKKSEYDPLATLIRIVRK